MKGGAGELFLLETIPALNDVNKEGSVPSFLARPSLGWWLAQQDCAVLEAKQSTLIA